MKKYIILFCLFITFLNYNLAYSFGLGDWTGYTPNGNEISNWRGRIYTILANQEIQFGGITEWYYYKNYVIGTCNCYPPYDSKIQKEEEQQGNYFVFNETTYQSHFFETELEWNTFLNQNNLKPKFWTKWNDGYEVKVVEWFMIIIVFYGVFAVPLLIWFVVSFYKSIKKEGFKFSNSYFISMICLSSLIFLTWILEQFPSSI